MFSLDDIKKRINNSDIAHRLASGAFWSFAGTILGKAIVLLGSVLCARLLGKLEYGEFGMVRSTVSMFVVFGTAGLGLTASKYISEFRVTNKKQIPSIYILTNGFAFITGIIITASVLFFSDYLADKTLGAPYLAGSIRIGAILLFVTIISAAQNGVLSGMEDFRAIAINTLVGSVFETVFMLLGAYRWGVQGAVLGFGIGYISLYVANYISICKLLKKEQICISFKELKKEDFSLLYKFSLPAALSSIMVAPAYWFARTLLVNTNGFGELAIYEASEQWRSMIVFIPGTLSNIVLPILSSVGACDSSKFWKILNVNILLNGTIAMVLALFVSLLSPFIIELYGSGFTDPLTLIVLSFSTIFSSVASVVGVSIASRAKMWIGFGFNSMWALMFIGFSSILLGFGLGAKSLAFGLLFSYIIHASLQYFYIRKITPQNVA